MEIWKSVENYENLYEVSSLGNIRKTDGKILSANKNNKYCQVELRKNTKAKTSLIHRLVAEAFLPNPENKKCVNHINGIKTDNRIFNLEWVTHGENNSHAIQTGLKKSIHPAKGIIQMDMDGKEIARYHSSEHAPKGFSSGCICLVANGKRNQPTS